MTTRILHVFGRMDRGGAELRTLELMRHLDRSRFGFDFCVLSGLPGALDEEIQELGGRVHRCALGRGFGMEFIGILKRHQYHVVHSHVEFFSGIIVALSRWAGAPVRIAHFRTMYDGRGSGLKRRLYRRLMHALIDRHATNILAVSRASMTSEWGNGSTRDRRCRVVYNGLDSSRFDVRSEGAEVRREFGFPAGCRLYIHIGNMHEAKNHPRLISIYHAISGRGGNSGLLLVGDDQNQVGEHIRSLIADLGFQDRIVCAGVRADIPRLLKAADLLLFPSLWEGLPGVVLEACIAGLPTLASDLPGIQEIAEAFPSVRCLSLGASDEQWADAAERICSGSGSVADVGAACDGPTSSRFSLERNAEILCSIWLNRSHLMLESE